MFTSFFNLVCASDNERDTRAPSWYLVYLFPLREVSKSHSSTQSTLVTTSHDVVLRRAIMRIAASNVAYISKSQV